jgi:TolB-like protein
MQPAILGVLVQSLLRALRQRKVDRVAAAYGVAAWIIVQGASIVLPTFGAPSWVLKVLIVAAIVGFPLVILVAWHAAPHPHHRRSVPPQAPGYADVALLALLSVVVLLSFAQFAAQMGLLPKLTQSEPPRTAAASLGPSDGAVPETSIAVLPFLNMSGDPKKEYFSDGISEELLNDLSNATNLRVAARTSSFAFKGKNEDIRKIARALNVRAVLEGSVREDGEHIRITAQLINAADGYHLWSKTYDRDLSNVLVVQDDIAREITAALTHQLAGSGVRASGKPATINPAAYRKYLEGQYFAAKKTDEGDAHAVELFKDVTAAQPDFAPGFAALGRTYIHMAEFHNQRADLVASAASALNDALRLDPNNLEALFSHLIVMLTNWDWAAATKDARRLRSLNPHSVFTLRGLSYYYGSLGFPQQQIQALLEATRLDPLSFVDLNNLAYLYNYEGAYDKAASAAKSALSLQSDRPLALYARCWASAGMKRFQEAQTIARKLSQLGQPGAADGCDLRIAIGAGRIFDARKLTDKIAGEFPVFVFDEADIGEFYAAAGNYQSAAMWLRRAYDRRDYDLFAIQYVATTPQPLLGTSGWKALMDQPEAKAWQTAHDQLATELVGR